MRPAGRSAPPVEKDGLATADDESLANGAGNLIIAAGTTSIPSTTGTVAGTRPRLTAIRTGTGDIDIAVRGDLTLSNRASVIYTAGHDAFDPQRDVLLGSIGIRDRGTLGRRPYPEQGGAIRIRAGGDINGVTPGQETDFTQLSNQLITNWLYRQGAAIVDRPQHARRATGWTVAYERFEQGIGALGGGDVTIDVRGDLRNVSVAIPSIGRQVGGTTPENNRVEIIGGGDLTLRSGGDIVSGVFYVGKGEGRIESGGSIRSGRLLSDRVPSPLHTILALGEGRFDVRSRGDLTLETVVNPTILPQSPDQKQQTFGNSYFFTYADDSEVRLASLTGDLAIRSDATLVSSGAFPQAFASDILLGDERLAVSIYPPRLFAQAVRGSILLNGDFTLFPSAAGQLELLAGRDIRLGAHVSLSDAECSTLPTVSVPRSSFVPIDSLDPAGGTGSFAGTPVHAGGGGEPVRIVARSGDIVQEGIDLLGNNVQFEMFLGKAARISAGRNISNLNLLVQHVRETDVSVLRVGADLVFPSSRSTRGLLDVSQNGIEIQGPGRLDIETGGNIDLGTASGITSLGDTRNGALADTGADITVLAGLNGTDPDYRAFIDRYAALAEFRGLPVLVQKPAVLAACRT